METPENTEKNNENCVPAEAENHIPAKQNALAWAGIVMLAIAIASVCVWCVPAEFSIRNAHTFKCFAYTTVAAIFLLKWMQKIKWWLGAILLMLFCIFPISAIYLGAFYGVGLNQHQFIIDCLNTNSNEAAPFFGEIRLYFLVVIYLAICCGIALLVKKAFPRAFAVPAKFMGTRFVVPAVWTISVILGIVFFAQTPAWLTIKSTKHEIVDYYKVEKPMFDFFMAREKKPQLLEQMTKEESLLNEAPIVVFHLGETAKADHASFNGYSRDTMPNLQKEFDRGNLISFPKCVSFATSTLPSTLAILTPMTIENQKVPAPTFISALNSADVKTIGFFSHIISNKVDSVLGAVTSGLSESNGYEELVDEAKPKILARIKETCGNAPVFYYYYGEGSHAPFTAYNKEKFSIFTPTELSLIGDNTQVYINNFDNTFRVLDDFVGSVIDELRDKNAVYILTGDHGNKIDAFGPKRPFSDPDVRHVMFFIWASDVFKQKNPELWARLVENQKKLPIVSHDFIYNTILHFYGIKTPYYQAKYDLLSENPEAYPHEIPPEDFNKKKQHYNDFIRYVDLTVE